MADGKVGSTPTTKSDTSSTPMGVTGGASSPNSGVSGPVTSSGKKIIPAGELGGSYSLDFYNREMGVDLTDPLEDAENEAASKEMDEFLKSEKEKPVEEKPAPQDEDDEEAKEEETPEEESVEAKEESDKEEKGDKKYIKAKDPSGKEIDLDPDLVILKKVDGEIQEIRLEDHLDIVAGELTVNQRLGKIASFKDTLEKKLELAEKRETQFLQNVQGIQKHLEAGDPLKGFAFMAEVAGKSPVEMFKGIMAAAEQAAKKFEGMSEAEVENLLLKMEIDHQRQKAQAKTKAGDEEKKTQAWFEKLSSILEDEKISQDEFKAATLQLSKEESWKSMSPDERADAAIERVLQEKHDSLVTSAIKKVNPNLAKNAKLVALIKEHTHPNEWTQIEVESLIRQLVKDEEKRLATNLSKKVGTQQKPATSQKSDAKPTKKTVATQSEMEKLFGLGSRYN